MPIKRLFPGKKSLLLRNIWGYHSSFFSIRKTTSRGQIRQPNKKKSDY